MTGKRARTLYTLSMIAIDALMTGSAFVIAYWLRLVVPFPTLPAEVIGFTSYLPMLAVQMVSVVTVFYFNKLYHVVRAQSRVDLLYNIFGALSVGTMLAVAFSALTFKNSIFELDFPRAMILYAWLLGIILVWLGRELHRRIWRNLRVRGVGRDRVIVVGRGDPARAIIRLVQFAPGLGYELIGVV